MSENRKLPEMNVPMWFDGKSINEALFCEDFLRTRQILLTELFSLLMAGLQMTCRFVAKFLRN